MGSPARAGDCDPPGTLSVFVSPTRGRRNSVAPSTSVNVVNISSEACASVSPSTLNDVSEQSPLAFKSCASTSVTDSVSSMYDRLALQVVASVGGDICRYV